MGFMVYDERNQCEAMWPQPKRSLTENCSRCLCSHTQILKLSVSLFLPQKVYRISSYNFRGHYSFLNLEIVDNSNSCRNISIFYLINKILTAETIQERKL